MGDPRVAFFYDLGSPYAWLAAERIDRLFEEAGLEPPEWNPVLLGGLFKRFGRGSWALTGSRDDGIAEIERRVSERGLPALRLPDPWPTSYVYAARAATWAKREGHGVTFALTAFRRAFTEGLDLADPANVRKAAADEGLDPEALDTAVASPEIKDELKRATAEAGDIGVTGIPSVVVGEQVFWGDDRLEDALKAAAGTRT